MKDAGLSTQTVNAIPSYLYDVHLKARFSKSLSKTFSQVDTNIRTFWIKSHTIFSDTDDSFSSCWHRSKV